MEYCEYSLEDYLDRMRKREEKAAEEAEKKLCLQERIQTALQIARDITAGLQVIHMNGQTHRDLKPKNGTPRLN
jgi:serine/threonine protein kinase